jgi:hypothetical protein
VAELWDIPLHEIVMRPPEMLSWAERGFRTHDGPTMPGLASQANMMAAARDAGIDVLLTGMSGDCWLRQQGMEITLSMLRGDWRGFAQWAWQYGWYSRREGAYQVAIGARDRLRGVRAEAYFEENAGTYFNRACLESIEREGMRNGLRVEDPFTDQELAMLLAGLPPHLRSMPSVTKFVVRKATVNLLPDVIRERRSWTALDPVIALALGDLEPGQTANGELWRRYADAWRRSTLDGVDNVPTHEAFP